MRELLTRYKEFTLRQIELLVQDKDDESLLISDQKNFIFLEIQKQKKSLGIQVKNEPEKRLVEEIITLNEKAVKLMQSHNLQISDELSKLKMNRQAHDAYGVSYSEDAYFFDRQK